MAPSHEDRVKILKAKREAFSLELDDVKQILEGSDSVTRVWEVKLRLEDLETEYAAFAKQQGELDTIEEGQLLRERLAIKSAYFQLRGKVQQFVAENTPTTSSHDTHSTHTSPLTLLDALDSEIQLPKLNLPNFSGKHEDWPSFSDQFQSAVHNNARLNDCKKLLYLRSCLRGEASQAVESLSNSAANYTVAWKLLEKRYDQPSVIVANHLKALFDQGSISQSRTSGIPK